LLNIKDFSSEPSIRLIDFDLRHAINGIKRSEDSQELSNGTMRESSPEMPPPGAPASIGPHFWGTIDYVAPEVWLIVLQPDAKSLNVLEILRPCHQSRATKPFDTTGY